MLSMPTLARVVAAVAVSTGLLAAPGAAGASSSTQRGDVEERSHKDKDKDKPKDQVTADAVGCHNIIGGKGSYSRVGGITGSLQMTMSLELPSCSGSSYALAVYWDSEGGSVAATQTIAGDGSSSDLSFVVRLVDTRPAEQECVFVVGTTTDADDHVHDVAPDAGRVEICPGSGATASFK